MVHLSVCNLGSSFSLMFIASQRQQGQTHRVNIWSANCASFGSQGASGHTFSTPELLTREVFRASKRSQSGFSEGRFFSVKNIFRGFFLNFEIFNIFSEHVFFFDFRENPRKIFLAEKKNDFFLTPKKKHFFSELRKKLGHNFDVENCKLSIGGIFRAIPALYCELGAKMCRQNFKNPSGC